MTTYRASDSSRIEGKRQCEKYGLDPMDVREITVTPFGVTAVLIERDAEGRPFLRDGEIATRKVRVR